MLNNRSALRKLLLAQRFTIGTHARQLAQTDVGLKIKDYLRDAVNPTATIALYAPTLGEIDVMEIAQHCNFAFALPIVKSKDTPLEFALWRHGDALKQDHYGIDVPAIQNVVRPDVLLVPCLGYNGRNYRLGYGGGYYDRTLVDLKSINPSVITIGIAFKQAECAFSPSNHDIAMHHIISG